MNKIIFILSVLPLFLSAESRSSRANHFYAQANGFCLAIVQFRSDLGIYPYPSEKEVTKEIIAQTSYRLNGGNEKGKAYYSNEDFFTENHISIKDLKVEIISKKHKYVLKYDLETQTIIERSQISSKKGLTLFHYSLTIIVLLILIIKLRNRY